MVLTSSLQVDTRGVEVGFMSGESLFEARDKVSRIKDWVFQEDTGIRGSHSKFIFPETSNPPARLYCDHCLDRSGYLSLLGNVFTTSSLKLIKFSAYNTSFKNSTLFRFFRLFILGAYLSSSSMLFRPPLGRKSLPLGLMDPFL